MKISLKNLALTIFVAVLVFILAGCGRRMTNADESFEEHTSPAMAQSTDNTKIGWGFKKEEGCAPYIPEDMVQTLKNNGGLYLGDTGGKNLYLTFDEGYENGYTEKILDTLKKTGTPAAFFITGDYIKTQPALVKRMADEGHIVGNHTNHHPSMPDKTDSELKEEIESLNKMYNDLTGKSMKYLRPPMGEYSTRTLALTEKLGYKTVLWSFAYVDWKTDGFRGADYAYGEIMPYLHDGAVILLHAVSKDNADVLERLIVDARAGGYSFKSLDEL